ncbi:MAG: hypothetical protein OXG35_20280 [Acidobacteria bacterium]|nr:hypothetical protein [Acidobacteriota bacterium]
MGADGLPLTSAFRLKPGEDYLSVNWLEYFSSPHLNAAVERVREVFRHKGYGLRPNGRFAVLRVGSAKNAVAAAVGRSGRVEHLPLDNDASHAGLFGDPSHDVAVAVELRALIQREHVHSAVPVP